MRHRRLSLAARLAVILSSVFVGNTEAQTCTSLFASEVAIRSDADTCDPGNLCPPGRTITFAVTPTFDPAKAACMTSVEWTMGDGSPATTLPPGTPMTKAYTSAGRYEITAKITTTQNSVITTTSSASVGIGIVSFPGSGATLPAKEELGVFRVKIVRTSAAGSTTVQWKANPHTAELGVRYPNATGQTTFPAGALETELEFPLINDSVRRGNQGLSLILVSADNGFLIGSNFVVVNIVDDEKPPTLAYNPRIVTVREDVGTAQVTVGRTGDMAGTVTCFYEIPQSFQPNNAVQAVSGTLIFGTNETQKIISVPVINDSVRTGPRTVSMSLSSPTGGAVIDPDNFFAGQGSLVIEDDELIPTISIDDVQVVEGREAGVFRLSITPPLAGNVASASIQWQVVGVGSGQLTDIFPESRQGSINVSSGATTTTLFLFTRPDRVPEPDETLIVKLTVVPFDVGRIALGRDTATLTILNDDVGLYPPTIRTSPGATQDVIIDVGSSTAQERSIPLRTLSLGVAEFPAAVVIPAGSSRGTFSVKALAPGLAAIEAVMPSDFPGESPTLGVTVHDGAQLVFSPPAINAFAGQDVTVHVSLQPASTNPETIPLLSLNPTVASVPATVQIPAGGSGSFVVKALKRGGTSIQTRLPDASGGQLMSFPVDVETAPDGVALAGIAPTAGSNAGGTAFEVSGSKLTADCRLLFGGVPAATTFVGAGLLTGITPPHAPGTVDLDIECNDSRFTLPNAFTYIASPASLKTVSPSFGTAAGGTHIRATGANFYSGCWLFFGNAAARGVTTNSSTEMTALTPAGKEASVDVSVRCGTSTSLLRAGFSYTTAEEPAPSIASVDPLIGAAGQRVTVTGSRFRPGDRITFDATPATILSTGPDVHIVRIPELRLGKSSVTLTDPSGRITTTGPIFTIIEPTPPQITTATPAHTFAGSELTLDGTGFRPGYTFSVGDRDAHIVSLDYTRVVIRLAGDTPPGEHRIEVHNTARQLAAVGPTLNVASSVVSATLILPACGSSDGGTLITIRGRGFAAGATVAFNGVLSPATVITANEMQVLAPASATGAARIVITNPNGDSTSLSDAFRYVSPFDPDACNSTRGRTVRH